LDESSSKGDKKGEKQGKALQIEWDITVVTLSPTRRRHSLSVLKGVRFNDSKDKSGGSFTGESGSPNFMLVRKPKDG